MHLGGAVVDDPHGDLADGIAERDGSHDRLKVKGKAVGLALPKDCLGSRRRECLEAALRVAELEAADGAEHLDIGLGCQTAQGGVALIAVLADVA